MGFERKVLHYLVVYLYFLKSLCVSHFPVVVTESHTRLVVFPQLSVLLTRMDDRCVGDWELVLHFDPQQFVVVTQPSTRLVIWNNLAAVLLL